MNRLKETLAKIRKTVCPFIVIGGIFMAFVFVICYIDSKASRTPESVSVDQFGNMTMRVYLDMKYHYYIVDKDGRVINGMAIEKD